MPHYTRMKVIRCAQFYKHELYDESIEKNE
jgi:hypothetical protein